MQPDPAMAVAWPVRLRVWLAVWLALQIADTQARVGEVELRFTVQ